MYLCLIVLEKEKLKDKGERIRVMKRKKGRKTEKHKRNKIINKMKRKEKRKKKNGQR